MNKTNNLLFIFCIFLISIAIIIAMMYFSGVCCFFDDDSWYSVYESNERVWDCLFGKTRLQHGGYYIGFFLSKFLSFGLPNLLSIHPGDFITYGQGFARSIFTVIALLLISKFAVYKTKAKSVYTAAFLFLASYFFFRGLSSCVLTIIYNFYRYFFSLIFFSIFWFYIYENIILPPSESKNEKYIYLNLIGVTICGFILGTSIEIAFYVSIFLASLIIFYNILLKLFSLLFKNESFLSKRYNIGVKFFVPVFGLLSGIILFVTNPGSLAVAKYRNMAHIYINYEILKEFSHLYFERCFKEELIYWIIFIVLMLISFYFVYKKKEIKEILLPLLFVFSILTVMFSLVLCGKTDGGYYFIDSHNNIRFLYKMLMLYPLLMFLNYLIRNNFFNNKIISVIIFVSAGICLYNTYIYFNSENYNNRFFSYKSYKINREIYYKAEKISRFYIERDENSVLLPDYSEDISTGSYPFWRLIGEKIINYTRINDYMKRVYKDEKKYEYIVMDKNKALEQFYSKGGTFTEEELKNIRFSRLFDKKFVLNEE